MPGFEPYTIDDGIKSKASEGGMRIPEGGYIMEILGCDASAEDQNTAHVWKLRVLEGAGGIGSVQTYWANMKDPHDGKKGTFFLTGTLIDSALPANEAESLQTGLDKVKVTSYKEHVALSKLLGEALKSKRVFALVADNNKDGTIYSKVIKVGPVSMYGGATPATSIALGPAPTGTPANNVQPDANFLGAAAEAFKNLGVKA